MEFPVGLGVVARAGMEWVAGVMAAFPPRSEYISVQCAMEYSLSRAMYLELFTSLKDEEYT